MAARGMRSAVLKRGDWYERVLIVLLILLWLAATAWTRRLAIPDEGRYVGVAWEMLGSGDWLTPTLNGMPYFHKPPLFYWITAGALSTFGLNEWAARVAPILGATTGAFALYAFTRRWGGRRAASVTLLVLLAHPLWYVGGQFANHDMLVAGCIGATILLLADAALCVERGLPHRKALAGAYLMAALGVLAKGLIGAVLPALVLLLWLAMMRRWRTISALLWAPGFGLFLLLAAPWFIVMQWRFADFFDYFFFVQHLKRFASGGFNNVQPFWYYPALLALFALPWAPWARGLFRREALADPEQGPVRLLMWLWLIVVVLFFSLPKSKLLGYVLPAVPPLAYLIADGFLAISTPSTLRKRLWWTSTALAGVVSIGVVIGLSAQARKSSQSLALALGAQRAPDEPVFMLQRYYFDLPFYARIRTPVAVVDDWASAHLGARDDWRKELADAGRFAGAAASSVLLLPAAFAPALCASPRTWVVGPASAVGTHPLLAQAREIARTGHATLWVIDAASPAMADALRCASTPRDDSMIGQHRR